MHPLHKFLAHRTTTQQSGPSAIDIDRLIQLSWEQFGYDFSGYARPSFARRLSGFMEAQNIPSMKSLMEGLKNKHIPWSDFLNEITVNVTEMFRDPEAFASLQAQVFPYLSSYPKLNIWIAGCSTGEEVYSCAILLHELGLLQRSVLYGTDINPQVLKQAKSGTLDRDKWAQYQQNYQAVGGQAALEDYFLINDHQIRLRPFLMEQMVFLPHNLAIDQSFNQFQLILCRNVCIYFGTSLQDKVAHLFDQSLAPLGFLVYGPHESLSPYWLGRIQLFDSLSNTYQKYPLQWKK